MARAIKLFTAPDEIDDEEEGSEELE